MNEETLNNLKQFIATTIHQEVDVVHDGIISLETKMNARFEKIDNRFDENDAKFDKINTRFNMIDNRFDENDNIQNEILNAIGEIQESQSKAIRRQADTIDNHERRILKLEKRTT